MVKDAPARLRPGGSLPPGRNAVSDTLPPPGPPGGPVTVGFLTILHDATGVLGGYLLTNAWGRPLEFRLTTAVQPNRVQQVLYGPTLAEYLHADLIGKTLVEKTGALPVLVVTDSLPALTLWSRIGVPVVALQPDGGGPPDLPEITHPRSSAPLLLPARFAAERLLVAERLEGIDPAVDLAEPFGRIREAIAEARKMGVTARAA